MKQWYTQFDLGDYVVVKEDKSAYGEEYSFAGRVGCITDIRITTYQEKGYDVRYLISFKHKSDEYEISFRDDELRLATKDEIMVEKI